MARLQNRPPAVPPRPGLRSLLAHERFGVLLTGNYLSAVGTFVHVAVSAWVLFELTGSSAMVGALTIAQFAPVVMLTLPAGIVIDHRDRRTSLLLVMSVQMALAFGLAALVWSGQITAATLLVVTAAMGVTNALAGPAWISYVGDIIPPAQVMLGFSLNSVSFHTAAMMGPPIGALLLRTVGPAASFAANGASFVAILAALLLMPKREPRNESFIGMRRAVGEMYRFARGSHRARRLLPVSAAIALVWFGYPAILPAYATDVLHGSAGAYGWLSGSMGAGSLLGAIVMGYLGVRTSRRRVIITGAWSIAAGTVLLATFASMAVAMTGLLLMGAGQLMLLVTTRTVIQMDAPEWLRGRAVSLWMMCAVGLGPLGGVLVGALADRAGIRTSVVLCAAYSVVLAAGLVAAARSRAGVVRPYTLDGPS